MLTQEQQDAAEAFVRAFGRSSRYGGGRQVRLMLPETSERDWIDCLDGWHGEDVAVSRVAMELGEAVLANTLPDYWRAVGSL